MYFIYILFVISVLLTQGITAYPYNDYIVAYIPIEDFARLTQSRIETMPLPPSMSYYGNVILYGNPRDLGGLTVEEISSPYAATSGPVSFGWPVNAGGSVSVVGGYGNQGGGTYVCYSTPASSVVVTTLPEYYATTPGTSYVTGNTLPGVTLPSTEFVPAAVSMPSSIVPVSTSTATAAASAIETIEAGGVSVTSEVDVETISTASVSNSALEAIVPVTATVASPTRFSGYVPASGGVRIYATFC